MTFIIKMCTNILLFSLTLIMACSRASKVGGEQQQPYSLNDRYLVSAIVSHSELSDFNSEHQHNDRIPIHNLSITILYAEQILRDICNKNMEEIAQNGSQYDLFTVATMLDVSDPERYALYERITASINSDPVVTAMARIWQACYFIKLHDNRKAENMIAAAKAIDLRDNEIGVLLKNYIALIENGRTTNTSMLEEKVREYIARSYNYYNPLLINKNTKRKIISFIKSGSIK